jgi:hypothetical protein
MTLSATSISPMLEPTHWSPNEPEPRGAPSPQRRRQCCLNGVNS